MRILHVVQGYTPAIGGTETLIQKLSEQLVQRYGDEVTVFTTTAARNCSVFWLRGEPTLPVGTERINGVDVNRFPIFNHFGFVRHRLAQLGDMAKLPFSDRLRALFNGPIIFGMTQAIARFRADVICASSFPFLHMHYALAGGKRSNTPVILHGALHTADPRNFDRPLIYTAISKANAYIANSTFEQNYLIARGIPAQKIITIGVGVDLKQFDGVEGQELREKYGWGNNPVIAFVGHLAKRKGVHKLLTAMPTVWKRYPRARLLLAGAGTPDVRHLEQLIARLPVDYQNAITIRLDFPEAEKAKIIAACDLLVFPSTQESFGIVLLEAWACRKPVIGLRAGAIPSIIDESIDGLLANPDEVNDLARAVCELLANPEQRTQMGEAGYQKTKRQYTWETVTDRFRQVYEQVQHSC